MAAFLSVVSGLLTRRRLDEHANPEATTREQRVAATDGR